MRLLLSILFSGIISAGLLVGCAPAPPKTADSTTATYVDADQASKGANAEDPSKMGAEPTSSEADIQQYVTAQKKADADFKAHPNDPKAKKEYIAKTAALGTASMTSDSLGRSVRYRQALHFYKLVLQVDPNNTEAKSNSKMIIDIYHQMGKKVPTD